MKPQVVLMVAQMKKICVETGRPRVDVVVVPVLVLVLVVLGLGETLVDCP